MTPADHHARRIKTLQDQWNLLDDLLTRLDRDYTLETRAEERLRIDHLRKERRAELAAIETELASLENNPASNQTPPPPPSGDRSINIGGNASGSVMVTGDGNTLQSGEDTIQKPHPPQTAPSTNHPVELFFSYAREDLPLRDELAKHLRLLERQHHIRGWHDRQILPGAEWAPEIDQHLNQARIILFLLSADFMASEYCYDIEVKRAMERHEAGEAVVIPVKLRPVDTEGAPFARLNGLPSDWKAVTEWPNRDAAFADIAAGIRKVAINLSGHAP